MRIALVHSYYSSDSPSGENRVVDSQVLALRASGHDVTLIAKHTDIESKSPLYHAKSAIAAAGYGLVDPLPEISDFRPDVIHVHNLFPNWGTRWMSRVSAPIVSTMHNYRTVCASALLWRDGNDCTDCLDDGSIRAVQHGCYRGSPLATAPLAWSTRGGGKYSATLNNSSALIALNGKSAEFFSKLRPRASVHTIPNFSDGDGSRGGTAVRDSWVFVGRLVPEKGVLWLLENWPAALKLIFIGAGPLSEDVEVACRKDPERFEYKGRLGPDETKEAIAGAHGLVIPSMWSEGIPTVALEALLSGTPILISNKCSSSEDLTHNGAGEIFVHDEESFIFENRVLRMSADPSYRIKARNLYRERYSRSVWLKNINSVYASVTGCAS